MRRWVKKARTGRGNRILGFGSIDLFKPYMGERFQADSPVRAEKKEEYEAITRAWHGRKRIPCTDEDKVGHLLNFALGHALWIVSSRGVMSPFTVTEKLRKEAHQRICLDSRMKPRSMRPASISSVLSPTPRCTRSPTMVM